MHVDYLNVIKDLASGLDYKLLISRHSSTHILSSLKEHLNENNVEQLSKLISGVPYQVSVGSVMWWAPIMDAFNLEKYVCRFFVL